jgi:hypothetical protein
MLRCDEVWLIGFIGGYFLTLLRPGSLYEDLLPEEVLPKVWLVSRSLAPRRPWPLR